MRMVHGRPDPLQAIYLGSLPATIVAGGVSEALFPNGVLGWRRSSPFDFRWACLHFCLANLLWYGIGYYLEAAQPKWRRLAMLYFAIRLLFVPATLSFSRNALGILLALLMLAWVAFGLLLGRQGLLRVVRILRPPTASTGS
jgi:hypothetical protein